MSVRSPRESAAASNGVRALAEHLSAELDAVRSLAEAVETQRFAVERTDAVALRTAAEEVASRSRRLADLARTRDRIMAGLDVTQGSGLDEVASQLTRRGLDISPIQGIGAMLRREATEVQRRVSVVRHAADRLSAHLAGVRALVQGPDAVTYGRRGRLATTDRSLAVDLRH